MHVINIREFNGFSFEKDLASSDGKHLVVIFSWNMSLGDFITTCEVRDKKNTYSCYTLEEAIKKYNSLS